MIKPAVQGTLNILRSCVKAKDSIKRVVLTSSCSAVSINKLEGVGLVMDEEAWSDLAFLTGEKPPTWVSFKNSYDKHDLTMMMIMTIIWV